MNKLLLSLTLVCSLLGLSGCKYMSEKIEVSYEPLFLTPVTAATDVKVDVSVVDSRREGTQVSRKKGDHGIELASIKLKSDLAQEVAQAVKTELKSMGFRIAPGNARVEIEIQKFYNEFKQGFFNDRGVAELMMNVHVKKKDDTITYSKTVFGIGEKGGVWAHSGKNTKAALESALRDGIGKLLKDQAFMQALTRSDK